MSMITPERIVNEAPATAIRSMALTKLLLFLSMAESAYVFSYQLQDYLLAGWWQHPTARGAVVLTALLMLVAAFGAFVYELYADAQGVSRFLQRMVAGNTFAFILIPLALALVAILAIFADHELILRTPFRVLNGHLNLLFLLALFALQSLVVLVSFKVEGPSTFLPYPVQFLDSRQSLIDRIMDGVSVIFLAVLGSRAITHLDTYWDSMKYHIPWAARLSGILPSKQYIFYPDVEALYLGAPKLTEFLQGWLWRATGLISATNLVAWLSILLVIGIASKRLRLKPWLLTLFLFSIPLVSIHSVNSYSDLPANCFVAIAFIGLLAAFEDNRFETKNLIAVLLPLAIAANMKDQTTIVAGLFFALTCLVFWFKSDKREIRPGKLLQSRARFLLVCFTCGLLFSANIIADFVRFGNPFYPLATKFGPISFHGPVSVGLAGESQDTNAGYKYVLSLSEIRLWTDNQGGLWSIDMSTAGSSAEDVSFKTGGYFVANLILWSSSLLLGCWYCKDRRYLGYTLVALGAFAVVSFFPVPYYLRYWLFLPMDLCIVVLLMYRRFAEQLRPVFGLVVILQVAIFLFVSYQVSADIFPRGLSPSYVQQTLSSLVMGAKQGVVQAGSPACVVFGDTRQGFLYKLAHWDLPMQSVVKESDCILGHVIYP